MRVLPSGGPLQFLVPGVVHMLSALSEWLFDTSGLVAAWILFTVGTGTDLALCGFRYDYRAGLFLHPVDARRSWETTERSRLSAAVMAVRRVYPALRHHALVDLFTLWAPLYGLQGLVKAATAMASIARPSRYGGLYRIFSPFLRWSNCVMPMPRCWRARNGCPCAKNGSARTTDRRHRARLQ